MHLNLLLSHLAVYMYKYLVLVLKLNNQIWN